MDLESSVKDKQQNVGQLPATPKVVEVWSETTLNYWMMVERYPNLKEEVGNSIPGYEIHSLLDSKTCQVVNCLLCFDVGLSTFCLKKRRKVVEVVGHGPYLIEWDVLVLGTNLGALKLPAVLASDLNLKKIVHLCRK